MRDKVKGFALPQGVSVSSPPVAIRSMANLLLSSRTELIDTTAVITRLIVAGWTTREIEVHYQHAVRMAMTRRINERRNEHA